MTAPMTTDHQMVDVFEDRKRCTACGVVAVLQYNPQSQSDTKAWTDWRAPDGRTWLTTPGGYIQPPSCPLPGVEALCPWEDRAMRYAGPKGDVQLDTAMQTWCERHQVAVADCPEPGPYCPGALAHEGEDDDSGCTGRENSCRCRCPACCGDDPHTWGYDGPF
ncbi:hypothetical protein [Streptomyces sp. NBC_01483]|uniref:hypothetical protein n=1 Tax=Streptomyces sp. NBC_01483 TaxID=2903883 RepID=UPI002E2EF98F|nr:hypothetical protein [Streptomyces sp. NBC_01483]